MIIEFELLDSRGTFDSDANAWTWSGPGELTLSSDFVEPDGGVVQQYKPDAVREYVRRIVEPIGGRVLTPAAAEPIDPAADY
jgi:hypothetical protein